MRYRKEFFSPQFDFIKFNFYIQVFKKFDRRKKIF